MSSKIEVIRICEYCKQEFTARTTVTRYCSHTCNRRAYKAAQKAKKISRSEKETLIIKTQPQEELKAKEFLNVIEASKLLGVSRRTIYRLFDNGNLVKNKVGRRTIIKRTDIDKLFS